MPYIVVYKIKSAFYHIFFTFYRLYLTVYTILPTKKLSLNKQKIN